MLCSHVKKLSPCCSTTVRESPSAGNRENRDSFEVLPVLTTTDTLDIISVLLTKDKVQEIPLGIDVDFGDSQFLLIEALASSGLVPDYNSRCSSSNRRIAAGDKIISVNGVTIAGDMVAQCRLATELQLEVQKA